MMNNKQCHVTFWSLLLAGTLTAQAGTLDPVFGTNGKVIAPVGAGDDLAHAAVLQPDGKIVVAGWTQNGLNFDFALARFHVDGLADHGFGQSGICTTAFGAADDQATSLVVQTDGRIVVAGYSFNGADLDIALARFNIDGTPDSTFGEGGRLTTDLGGTEYAAAVAVQPDGKIVVAGHLAVASPVTDFLLARYLPDGTLDTGFGIGGFLNTDFDHNIDFGASVLLQPDGKIIVAGLAVIHTNYEFALARYNSDGSPDSGFGINGKCTTDIGPSDDKGISVLLQPDGKVLLGGFLHNGADYDFALVRYQSNGIPDQNFGTNGKIITDFNGKDDLVATIALQPDGKILAAGRSSNGIHYNFAMTRYLTDGKPDTGFGDAGKVVTQMGSGLNSAFSVLFQTTGKIVLAGHAFNGANQDFALARYEAGTVVGTNDPAAGKIKAVVYPNPAEQFVTLEYALSEPAAVSILLFDAQGNSFPLLTGRLQQFSGTHTQSLRLPDSLPSGIYYIFIEAGTRCAALPVLKPSR